MEKHAKAKRGSLSPEGDTRIVTFSGPCPPHRTDFLIECDPFHVFRVPVKTIRVISNLQIPILNGIFFLHEQLAHSFTFNNKLTSHTFLKINVWT